MATFRVGQRVRLINPVRPENLGEEGVFAGYELHYAGEIRSEGRPQSIDTDCLVRWDSSGRNGVAASWQLSPIQPERNRIVAWEDLALPFDPRKVGETA